MCVLIFGNFKVYWRICENLSPWNLFYLMKINPFKVFIDFDIKRSVNSNREQFYCLIVWIEGHINWPISTSAILQQIFHLQHWHSTCKICKGSHRRCSVKRCSQKFCKIHRKTPVPGLFFNKVAGLSQQLY